jgi:hypothetical protein
VLSWHHVSEAISSGLHPAKAAALLPGGRPAAALLLEAAGLPPRAWSTFDSGDPFFALLKIAVWDLPLSDAPRI